MPAPVAPAIAALILPDMRKDMIPAINATLSITHNHVIIKCIKTHLLQSVNNKEAWRK